MTPVSASSAPNPHDDPRGQDKFLEALHRITLDLLSHRDLDELLQAIAETASQILAVPNVEIVLREGELLVVRAAIGLLPDMHGQRVNRHEASLTWRACDELKPVIMDDYSQWTSRRTQYDDFHIHAVASIPIMINDACAGTVDLSRVEIDQPFTPDEIQKALLFTQMVALLLENNRLNETAAQETEQRKQADAALRTSEERLRAAAQLQLAQQREIELSDLKSRMMTRIGHELRTPLSIIQLSSEMLELYPDKLSDEARQARLNAIRQQVSQVSKMLDTMGGVVRGSLIPDQLLLEHIDFSRFCKDILDEIAGELSIPVVFRTHIEPGIEGMGDYAALRNAFRSLLNNAVQYSLSPAEPPPQNHLAGGEVTVELRRTAEGLCFAVKDQGIGIPQEELDLVFEPFFRGSNTGNTRGLGLGLTVARAVVEAHRGKLTVESAQDEGTTVTIQFPL